jgi:hypothetical protein
MPFRKPIICFGLIAVITSLSACAGKTQFRSACDKEVETAWSELSIAKAEGFSGTLSYTKALSLITAARAKQAVENFDGCYNSAKDARFYILESRKGQ